MTDATWGTLAARYDVPALVEIPLVVGQYAMLSMFANALPAGRIQILHTNDIHGHLDITDTVQGGSGSFSQGGLVAMAQQVERLRGRQPGGADRVPAPVVGDPG